MVDDGTSPSSEPTGGDSRCVGSGRTLWIQAGDAAPSCIDAQRLASQCIVYRLSGRCLSLDAQQVRQSARRAVSSLGSLPRGIGRFLTQNRPITIEIGESGVFARGIAFDGDIRDGVGLH